MDKKYIGFLKNAQELNKKFGIVPLLYGSLGLEVLTNSSLNSDDIDILIPERFVKGQDWNNFREYLENNNYVLIDEHEHTFRKDNIDYSYASIENLKEFADINIEEIPNYEDNDSKFLILTLEQYLKVYKKSAQDGYRVNKKEKQDGQKIKFIEEQIQKSNLRKI